MKKPVLVVMAAGMGSRYGGLKQIDPVDKEGHIIMDFSIYDAVQAGFRKVVFIIKKENEADFRSAIGDRLSNQLEVSYVFQDLHNIPEGYEVPEGRVKPWGTGHAVLSCINEIDGPFVVINADDYYGSHAFKMAYDFLTENEDTADIYRYMMVGYKLENTLTENGHVARGVCVTDEEGHLLKINERTHIEKHDGGTAYTEDDGKTWTMLPEGSTVSMNMWGFSASILKELKDRFPKFLDENLKVNPLKCEYFLPFVVDELQNALACAGRIFDLLEEEPEVAEASETLKDVKGEVDIKNVCFHYDESKKLIEDFNLHVKPGMRVAIVGPTGCGKSTFINLLMRFYDVNSGSISVDGKPIRDITRHSLRSSYGMVLQETWIKNGTVRDNISIGKPEATDTEIIEAAKLTHSWEFIRRLPKGLDTMLNEDSLSQGQKQLLCITRVMLCLPPMLILDEATSSIDTRTELQIQEAFERMMEGRTSFIVAHRLSTIRNADLILVMKDGSIIEQGTHDELIAKGGFYHTLYNSQFAKVSE